MPHEALPLELAECSELLVRGHGGVDPVELVKVDPLQPESPQTVVQPSPEELRPAVGHPPIRTGPLQPSLGGDDQALGIGVQRLGDDLFGNGRTVGISGVDEVHAKIHGPAKDLHCLRAVPRLAPDAFPGEPHRAEPHPVDDQVPAQGDEDRKSVV